MNELQEQILALLVAKFQGVRKDGLQHLAAAIGLQVATIEEANGVVDKLTADKVSQYVTDWRKVADAEISKANQTYENGLKEKYDFVEKGKQTPPTPPTPPAGAALVLAAAESADTTSAFKYVPKAMTGDSYDVEALNNHFVTAVTIGQFKESVIPAVSDDIKAALPGISLI